MSSKSNIEPKEWRKPEHPLHVLFVGEKLSRTNKYFKRADELVRCDYAADIETALEMIIAQSKARPFDCVMIDMRRESDGAPHDVAGIARLKAFGTLAVMAVPSQMHVFEEIDGVDEVMKNPVERADIIRVVIASSKPRSPKQPEFIQIPKGFSSSEPFSARSVAVAKPVSAAEPVEAIVEETTEAVGEHSDQMTPDNNLAQSLPVHQQIEKASAVLEELALPTAHVESEKVVPAEVETDQPKSDETRKDHLDLELPAYVAGPYQPVEAKQDDIVVDTQSESVEISGEPVISPEIAEVKEAPKKSAVTQGFESSLSKIQEVDQGIWQRFVPLANFVYKKLAIIVLTALFATFVAYGSMIVFFMGSSSWSLPFELSRGHALVEKVDRDLSSMSLRRNQVNQDLTVAKAEGVTAERSFRDGKLQLTLTRRTIEEEIISQTATQLEIRQHIDRLKRVINDFNALNGKGGFAKNLEGAYSKRLITRKSLNSGTLAVLETLHRMATVQNEISIKQLELRRVDRRLEFLRSLLEEIDQPEIRVITSAGSDLAHLAREVIEAKNRIATAAKAKVTADKRVVRLDNSLEVISANINLLEASPAGRARAKPVMVLFVPYANAGALQKDERLYSCVLSIILCSHVGEVGDTIDGETTAVHPLFGKPMRGNFVEAKFDNAGSVREELMHAGSAPLLF